MAEELVLIPEQTAPAPERPETLPMGDAIEQIRKDSRHDPEGYLEETVAPFGGE
jgi:hypothetical protein